MSAIKLSQVVQTNIPKLLILKNATGKKYESQFKAGEFQYLYFFTDETGVEYVHYASEPQNEVLQNFKNGDRLQLVKQEKKTKDGKAYSIYVWTTPEGAEATLAKNPPVRSNTQQRTHEEKMDVREQEDRIKQVMISLAGLTQAHISAGKTNEEALRLASEARNLIIQKAISVATAND